MNTILDLIKTADDNKGVDSEGKMTNNEKEDIGKGENLYGIGAGVKAKSKSVVKTAEPVMYVPEPVPGTGDGMFFKAAMDGTIGGDEVPSASHHSIADISSMGHGKMCEHGKGKGMCPKCPGSEKKAEPNTQVDGADRTGRDYTGPLAGPRNALFGTGDGVRTNGVNESGSFSSAAANQLGHGKMKKTDGKKE